MAVDSELKERKWEFEYASHMSKFYKAWIKNSFAVELDVRCDEMVTHKRSMFNRLDTHTIIRDHRSRGQDTYHFYLCNFRPMWTDCTCEGYHAENFGMIYWQKPKKKDDVLFLAEKNCTAVSHELSHELLRQKKYKRFVPDVHDIWTKHFHAGLEFEQYDSDFKRTDGKPMFLTLDASAFRNI